MQISLLFVTISNVILVFGGSPTFFYKNLQIDKCTSNENVIVIERCESIAGVYFSAKVKIVSPLDYILVSALTSNDFKLNLIQFFFKAEPFFFVKRNGKFQEIFKTEPINWCEFSAAPKKSDKMLLKLAVLFFKKKAPQLFNPCPLQPFTFEKTNASFDNTYKSFVPKGLYRGGVVLKNQKKEVFFELKFSVETV